MKKSLTLLYLLVSMLIHAQSNGNDVYYSKNDSTRQDTTIVQVPPTYNNYSQNSSYPTATQLRNEAIVNTIANVGLFALRISLDILLSGALTPSCHYHNSYMHAMPHHHNSGNGHYGKR